VTAALAVQPIESLSRSRGHLQPLERRVLSLLAQLSPLSLKQIGVALGISPQHARTLLCGLESHGYVARTPPAPLHNRFTRHVYRLRAGMQA
jgi:predicted ArsR family transcriptional regulator